MTIETTKDLLVEQLQDLYDAEKQLVKALPKIVEAAHSDELRDALHDHFKETQNQVRRLEQAFESLGLPPETKSCKGMKGLIAEGKDTIKEEMTAPFGDLALIAAAQRVEHYEISGYGTARAMAQSIGQEPIVALLEATLQEESQADTRLTGIAMSLMSENEGTELLNETADSPTRRPARVGG